MKDSRSVVKVCDCKDLTNDLRVTSHDVLTLEPSPSAERALSFQGIFRGRPLGFSRRTVIMMVMQGFRLLLRLELM